MNSSHANEKFRSLSLLPCLLAGGCSGVVTMSRRNSETMLFCSVHPTLPPPLTPLHFTPTPPRGKKKCHAQTTFMMSFVMQVCLLTEHVLALFHHFTEFLLASPSDVSSDKKKKPSRFLLSFTLHQMPPSPKRPGPPDPFIGETHLHPPKNIQCQSPFVFLHRPLPSPP